MTDKRWTMADQDGGPAFPCEQGTGPGGEWNQTFERGMSLRDWFAGQALKGILASPLFLDHTKNGPSHPGSHANAVAAADAIADLAIAEREQRA